MVSLASDSADPDRVYAAVGTYTNDWDPANGAVLRSTDRGASWKKADLPFKLGGNMPGRGMGNGWRSTRTATACCTWARPAGTGCGGRPTRGRAGRRSRPSPTRELRPGPE
ncbi:hypothetical protein GCM10023238_17880 [Streptomyces heliomycini]